MPPATAAKPLPMYLQIAELLARQIKAGWWRTGERLPTEAELAQRLQVAVGTLRKALALLEEQGVLERIQGSGTYVRKVQGTQRIYELFRLELKEGPGLPTAQLLSLERVEAPQDMPRLQTCASRHYWRARRLRFLSQVPVALEEIWFQAPGVQRLTPQEIGDSMYLFYQERFDVWITRVEDHLAAAPAPDWASSPSGLAPGDCAGYVERLSFTASNQLAEFSRTWFDPKVCRYSSRLSQ